MCGSFRHSHLQHEHGTRTQLESGCADSIWSSVSTVRGESGNARDSAGTLRSATGLPRSTAMAMPVSATTTGITKSGSSCYVPGLQSKSGSSRAAALVSATTGPISVPTVPDIYIQSGSSQSSRSNALRITGSVRQLQSGHSHSAAVWRSIPTATAILKF